MYVKRYLENKRQEIYCKMQSTNLKIQQKAIIQWDKIEMLLQKLDNNCSENYINNLYNKIQNLQMLENKLKGNTQNIK